MSKYDDIINLERPFSKRRNMPLEMRAAQFAPFSALTGYNEAIKEKARLTDGKIDISDATREVINKKLIYIKNNIKEVGDVTITYFIPDGKKTGGKYVNITGKVKKIDGNNLIVYMMNDTKILFDDISNISSDLFDYFEM